MSSRRDTSLNHKRCSDAFPTKSSLYSQFNFWRLLFSKSSFRHTIMTKGNGLRTRCVREFVLSKQALAPSASQLVASNETRNFARQH